jgi:hypothetical protein
MLFQTPKFDHSWFVNFDKQLEGMLPFWFSKWWERFGPPPEVFPLKLIEAFESLKNHYKVDAHSPSSPLCYILLKK